MKKGPEKSEKSPNSRRKIQIPLPRTLSAAFMKINSDFEHWVGVHTHLGPKHPNKAKEKGKEANERPSIELSLENHKIFLGKMFKLGTGDKILRVLGWGKPVDNGMYTEEFVEGALCYAFENAKKTPGDRPSFVVCPSLSELFNGYEDVENAMSSEEQINLIRRIAKEKFGKGDRDLDVEDLEKMIAHKRLFEVLRAHVDENAGVVNMIEAMASIDDKEEFGNMDLAGVTRTNMSLFLTKFLLAAALRNEQLFYAFLNAVPPRLREKDADDDQETQALVKKDDNEAPEMSIKDISKMSYAITEVAIRLSEIMQGRTIHGGVDRQGKYDEIIKKIVLGKSGGYKNIEDLEPLFKIFEKEEFTTVHIDTELNPSALRLQRNIAWIRLLLYSALSGLAVFGAYERGKHVESDKQAQVMKLIDARLQQELIDRNDISFRFEGKWQVGREKNVSIFRGIVNDFMEEMKRRYLLDDEQLEGLKPFLMEYMIANKFDLPIWHGNWASALTALDKFLQDKEFYFLSKNIKIGKPYAHFFKYMDLIKKAIEGGPHISQNMISQYHVGQIPIEEKNKNLRKIGEISASGTYAFVYTAYVYTDEKGEEHLLAMQGTEEVMKDVMRSSTANSHVGYEVAMTFMNIQQRHDLLSLAPYFSNFVSVPRVETDKDCNFELNEDSAFVRRIPDYVDTFGRFKYELATYDDPRDGHEHEVHLVAKVPGEKLFTSFRACEAAEYFEEATHFDLPIFDRRDVKKANPVQCEIFKNNARSAFDQSLNSRQNSVLARSNSQAKGYQHRSQHRR